MLPKVGNGTALKAIEKGIAAWRDSVSKSPDVIGVRVAAYDALPALRKVREGKLSRSDAGANDFQAQFSEKMDKLAEVEASTAAHWRPGF